MNNKIHYNTVLVFGVFDLLHDGHREFLRQAGEYGEKIIAVVARDSIVQRLKNKTPQQDEEVRRQGLLVVQNILRAELGDFELGEYSAIKKYQPDAICLGYDQGALGEDLALHVQSGSLPKIPIVLLEPHEPDRLHSSILTDFKK